MSKIVQAVNAMIGNPDKITKVVRHGQEFFFLYKNKHKWSISDDGEGNTTLWFYAGDETIDQLAAKSILEDWKDVNMITYKASEIGTKEAHASFAELFTVIRERLYGVDKVLDDIIGDNW